MISSLHDLCWVWWWKKNWKSVNICLSYGQLSRGSFLWNTVYKSVFYRVKWECSGENEVLFLSCYVQPYIQAVWPVSWAAIICSRPQQVVTWRATQSFRLEVIVFVSDAGLRVPLLPLTAHVLMRIIVLRPYTKLEVSRPFRSEDMADFRSRLWPLTRA